MRKTTEQLIADHPWLSTCKQDIVQSEYGDIPSSIYDEARYRQYQSYTGTLANIGAVEAYIYANYGSYQIFDTRIGRILISKQGALLCGDISVKHRGLKYSVTINMMYGWRGLRIMRISSGGIVHGWRNPDGGSSPARTRSTKELEPDIIEAILNAPMPDYGYAVQFFLTTARSLYAAAPKNHFLKNCFDL